MGRQDVVRRLLKRLAVESSRTCDIAGGVKAGSNEVETSGPCMLESEKGEVHGCNMRVVQWVLPEDGDVVLNRGVDLTALLERYSFCEVCTRAVHPIHDRRLHKEDQDGKNGQGAQHLKHDLIRVELVVHIKEEAVNCASKRDRIRYFSPWHDELYVCLAIFLARSLSCMLCGGKAFLKPATWLGHKVVRPLP